MARLSRQFKEFIQERLDLICPMRTFNLHLPRMSSNKRPLPRRRMWLTRCFNIIRLEMKREWDLLSFVAIMKHFRTDITLNLHFYSLKDEDQLAEKFVNVLGYFKLDTVKLDTCFISLRASCMFLLQPPRVLHAINSYINFCKTDQIINAERLKLVNTRVHCKVNNPEIFKNVKRAYLSNILIKDIAFTLFSHRLEELVL